MRCHYVVLGLEEDADVSEIKKSFRKLALKYHPDKNQGNESEAAAQFRECQQAYATLSDAQERAWYDKHKEALLMKSGAYEDKEVNLGPYCSTSCYVGFGYDEKGFYAVYQKLFKDLSEEDYTFMDADEEDYPQFGDADTDVEFVVSSFYGFWTAFATKKSYVWEEDYDTREAPNRWVKRKMEQENNKKTEQTRKERSKEVQAVVDWIRRKDPRVKAYKEKLEERKKEIEAKAAKKRAQKMHSDLLAAAKYEEENLEQRQEEEDDLAKLERELYGSESDTDFTDSDEDLPEDLHDLTEDQKDQIRSEMAADEKLLAQKLADAPVNDSESEEEFAPKLSKKAKKKLKQRQKEQKAMNNTQENTEEVNEPGFEELEPVPTSDAKLGPPPEKKLSAKEKRRLREMEKQEAASKRKEAEKAAEIPSCRICEEVFESRSQLFKHIKETGHAELKSMPHTSKGKKGKKR